MPDRFAKLVFINSGFHRKQDRIDQPRSRRVVETAYLFSPVLMDYPHVAHDNFRIFTLRLLIQQFIHPQVAVIIVVRKADVLAMCHL